MSKVMKPRIIGNIPFGDSFTFPVGFLASKEQSVEDALREVQSMKLKQNDVLICSYPKSGTHWVGNLVAHLLDVNDADKALQGHLLEDINSWNQSTHLPKVRFSHLRPQWLPQEHLKTGGKIVLCMRNPKDVAVSYFHHLDRVGFLRPRGSWDAYLNVHMSGGVPFGSFVHYVQEWDKMIQSNVNLDVNVIFYEDLVTNGFSTLKKLQDHLGTNKSDEELQKIYRLCSFENLKQQADQIPEAKVVRGLRTTDGKLVIYRKGEIGDWKNLFTDAQSKAFDHWVRSKLKNCILARRWNLLSSKY